MKTMTTITTVDPSHLTLESSKPSEISKLCGELKLSLKHPSGRTLRLLEKALSYLTPFESSKASVASPAERQDLLTLLRIHRLPLSPYLDLDRIERNLRFCPPFP